jgi:hypothetical protein
MSVALTVLLIAFCVQGLFKFAVGFLVPYRTRINRIASYYRRDGRIISIYDSVTLAVIVALVALLFLTDMHAVSFITGLIAGMLLIQISFTASTDPSHPNTRRRNHHRRHTTHVVRDPCRPRPGLGERSASRRHCLSGPSTNSSTSSSTRASRDGGPDQCTSETPLTVSGVCAADRCAGVRVDDTGRQRLSVGRTPRARSPTLLRCGRPAPSEL